MLDVADADPVALVGPRYVAVNQLVQLLPGTINMASKAEQRSNRTSFSPATKQEPKTVQRRSLFLQYDSEVWKTQDACIFVLFREKMNGDF